MELSDGAGAVPPAPPQPHKNHNNDHHRHGSGSKKYAKKPADSTIPYDPTKPITQTDIKMAVDAGDISLIRNFIEQTRSK
jgi:hypothetical protein